jgi:hypothetical protein
MVELTTGNNRQIYVKAGEYGIEWKPVNAAQWSLIEDEDFIVWPLSDEHFTFRNTTRLIDYI